MQFNSLRDAFVHELKDLYNAERRIMEGLPKMASCATHETLKAAFTMHLEETRKQVTRLEQAFSILGEKAEGETCEAMEGLVKEGEEILEASGHPDVIDALLIGAAQRIEHYEIAGYGTARAMAKELGFSDIVDLLQETLDEEGAADKKLTAVAEGGLFARGVNADAKAVANG